MKDCWVDVDGSDFQNACVKEDSKELDWSEDSFLQSEICLHQTTMLGSDVGVLC